MDSRRSVPLADIDDVLLNTPSSWWDIPVAGGFAGRAWAARLAKSYDDAHPLLKKQLLLLQRRLMEDDHNAGTVFIDSGQAGSRAVLWMDLVQGESEGDADVLVSDFVTALPEDATDIRHLSSTHETGRLVGAGATFAPAAPDGGDGASVRKTVVVLSVENDRHQMVRLLMETDLPEVPEFGPADAHLMQIAERMTVLF